LFNKERKIKQKLLNFEVLEASKSLVKKIGVQELTIKEGHFLIMMVQNTGSISSKQIEIAKNSCFEKHQR